jgi:NAD(P)H-dependent FMN reductase
MKKLIAFAGSNSSKSINKQLVAYTVQLFEGFDIEWLDMNDFEMPLYSIDREQATGIPEKASLFRGKIHQADGIICSLAEHNRSYTVAFKNVFDWCSRIDMNIFGSKPMLLMSTSPGGFGGGNVMNAAKGFFPKCAANVIETFSLPSFQQNFAAGAIANEVLREEHAAKVKTFLQVLQTTVD